ncbi:MAG: Ig-like domain-containing protein [Mogibacterium sp.]|nr:Ig-like domain-containing protein [Mogibacterium sp.]
MKRLSLIAAMAAILVMISAAASFAAGGLELVSSYPEDGQTNTSMENLGVKLTFSNPINSEEAKKIDEGKFTIVDEDGEKVPTQVLFSEKNDGLILVLADIDKGFTAKNNAKYKLTIDAGLVDNEGNIMEQSKTITFRTYNQKVNTIVNMVMMTVLFGGLMVLTMRQNLKKEEDTPAEETKEAAFNPYKEAKRTGKSVDEIMAEQAKREAKLAKKKARKAGKAEEDKKEKKIENCAGLLNNVYHVHAPAPTNKADRSIEAMKAARKTSSKSSKSRKK